jgi:hypothetical protein
MVNAVASIIAVHGISGDSFSTWTDKASKTLWLRDLLPQSPYFAACRILTFGYDAKVWIVPARVNAQGRVFTFAEQLLVEVRTDRIRNHAVKRPIIFIGHPLGGIVIKKVGPAWVLDVVLSTKEFY